MRAVTAEPKNAGLLIWDGIITSTLAGLKGGLGALSLAKEARDRLQQAEQLQPGALDGSALTSLGALYYQVPGWPIGFGNKDKARSSLQAALKIDPAGIDANYFYADFLLSQGDLAGARAAAERALAAPVRPGREVADNGRRAEIRDAAREDRQSRGRVICWRRERRVAGRQCDPGACGAGRAVRPAPRRTAALPACAHP